MWSPHSKESQTWMIRPRKDGKAAEERYTGSYPFHPDFIHVFYSKWTNLEGFQRTRGGLRTFALALRGVKDATSYRCINAGVKVHQWEEYISETRKKPPGENLVSLMRRPTVRRSRSISSNSARRSR
jgi:predicted AAA+ superfamily ATPase